jgi:arylsulfatase A-like enzyme
LSFYNVHKPAEGSTEGGGVTEGKADHTANYKEKLRGLPEPKGPATREERHGKAFTHAFLHQRNPEFAAMIRSVDDSVGRVTAKLAELGLDRNTIVIFTSDQGSVVCTRYAVTSNLPYRLGKSWLFDGGLRVPLIVKYPGRAPAGGVSRTVTMSTDFFPTILDLVGLPPMPERHRDGVSIREALHGTEMPFDRVLYWLYPRSQSGNRPSVAIRRGRYKLIDWFEDDYTELFDIDDDPGESVDLSASLPDVTRSLKDAVRGIEPVASYFARGR